jgi:hypothetical protein
MAPKSQTPGLIWRVGKTGRTAFWKARNDFMKAGCPVKTVRLWRGTEPTAADMAMIAERCQQLQHEVLDWKWKPSIRKGLRVDRHSGFIYFALCGDKIKIGFAVDPKRRVAHLQGGSPDRLELLATIPGSPRLERQLHHRFKGLRHSGEWFRQGPNLLEFIENARSPKILTDSKRP